MDIANVVTVASAAGVAIGLGIYSARQKKDSAGMSDKIRQALTSAESLTLPELVAHVGLNDGFMSRGKVMAVLNPMVASGELLQEEPPGTTAKDRLSVLRFRRRTS